MRARLKPCKRCGEWLDDSIEFRRLSKRPRRDGRVASADVCRACENRAELARIYREREEYQEQLLELAREARRAMGDYT